MNKNNELRVRLTAWIGINAVLVIFAVLIFYTKHLNSIGVICPIHNITGIDCPGCGGTRMMMSLFNLDIYQALRYNMYLCISLLPMLILYFYESFIWIKYNILSSWLDRLLMYWSAGLIIFGLLRNLAPFRVLAPTIIR